MSTHRHNMCQNNLQQVCQNNLQQVLHVLWRRALIIFLLYIQTLWKKHLTAVHSRTDIWRVDWSLFKNIGTILDSGGSEKI